MPTDTKTRTVAPCAKCGTLEGARRVQTVDGPPVRCKGKCKSCYQREEVARKAVKDGRVPYKAGKPKRAFTPACVGCGTLGGSKKAGTPARYRHDARGRPGPFCGACWNQSYRAKKRGEKNQEMHDYLPDEATIAKRAKAAKLLVLGSVAIPVDEAVLRQRANAERARVERLLRRAEIDRAFPRFAGNPVLT